MGVGSYGTACAFVCACTSVTTLIVHVAIYLPLYLLACGYMHLQCFSMALATSSLRLPHRRNCSGQAGWVTVYAVYVLCSSFHFVCSSLSSIILMYPDSLLPQFYVALPLRYPSLSCPPPPIFNISCFLCYHEELTHDVFTAATQTFNSRRSSLPT